MIPQSVVTIGSAAFAANNLTSIAVDQANTVYKSDENCIIEIATNTLIQACPSSVIPDYIVCIGPGAFYALSNIESIEIPNSVIVIEESAFKNTDLVSVDIPNSVTYIGEDAFANCISLESIVIPDSVDEIGIMAFFGCDMLTSVTLSNSLTAIPESAFDCCLSLESIIIPNSVKSIGPYAFSDCECLMDITIGNSVETIGDWAFQNCMALESIVLPKTLKYIGDGAFSACVNMTSIEFLSKPEYFHEHSYDEELDLDRYPSFLACFGLKTAGILCHTSGGWVEGDKLSICSDSQCILFNVTIIDDGLPLPVMYIGTTPITAIYLGSTNISNIL
jgi:hypothetical protein